MHIAIVVSITCLLLMLVINAPKRVDKVHRGHSRRATQWWNPNPGWLPIGPLPNHVMFTTMRSRNRSALDDTFDSNTVYAVSLLERTRLIRFDESDPSIGKNSYGLPVLRDMFIQAMQRYPSASTYTYFNSDLIFNVSFVATVDAVVYASRHKYISEQFLMIGERTNVEWRPHFKVTDFETILRQHGTVFGTDAIDYFTCSRKFWDWHKFPPFVVGRVAYDNFLVNLAMAKLELGITVVDASKTSPVIHQTGPAGNFQGRDSGRDDADTYYNTLLSQGQVGLGRLEFAYFLTMWTSEGRVQVAERVTPSPTVFRRKRSLDSSQKAPRED